MGGQFTIPTTCQYSGTPQSLQYIFTPASGTDFAFGSGAAYANGANCGRCVELVRSSPGGSPLRVTVTLVGSCNDPVCVANPNQARFQVSLGAYPKVAPANEPTVPLTGETLTYSFVACPVPSDGTGAPQPIRETFLLNGANGSAVTFYQQRYGIASATVEIATGNPLPLQLGNDARWYPVNGNTFGSGALLFRLTDVNNRQISFNTMSSVSAGTAVGVQFPTCVTTP
jgi:hypothetical protein